jgi:hypothetical protein
VRMSTVLVTDRLEPARHAAAQGDGFPYLRKLKRKDGCQGFAMGKEEQRVGKGGPARVYEVGRSQEQ